MNRFNYLIEKKEYLYMAMLALLWIFPSCSSSNKEDDKLLIKNIIITYTTELEKTYKNFELNLLPQITTKNEIKRIETLLQVLKRNKENLPFSIEKLIINEIHLKSKNEAESDTIEIWKYSSLPLSSSKASHKTKIQKYNVHYIFFKEQGIWKIDQVQMHPIN
jgi:hypothetical protein